jgi:hypothetical protein
MSESTMTIDEAGNKFWRNTRGKCHRTNGPAAEYSNGRKEWCINGNYHRTDGPAVEHSSGGKEWYVNGKYLGLNDSGFWALWDSLSNEDRANPTLLTYLPGGFNV